MASVLDYLKEHKVCELKAYDNWIRLELQENNAIKVSCPGGEIILPEHPSFGGVELRIQGYLDIYDIGIRFCHECGKPINEGLITDDASYICCHSCFTNTMDRDFGKGNWRMIEDGEDAGYYQYYKNGQWVKLKIMDTDWLWEE